MLRGRSRRDLYLLVSFLPGIRPRTPKRNLILVLFYVLVLLIGWGFVRSLV